MNSTRAEAQNFFATAETDLDQGIARVQKALETCRNCSENLSYSTNSGANRAIVFGETVVYTCNEGYSVDFSEKQFQLDAKCSEEAEFTNLLECLPADCRAAPEPSHTRN